MLRLQFVVLLRRKSFHFSTRDIKTSQNKMNDVFRALKRIQIYCLYYLFDIQVLECLNINTSNCIYQYPNVW